MLWAQVHGVLAEVAALRETSVVVAAGIGAVFFFRERFGARRVAAALVAVGIVSISA